MASENITTEPTYLGRIRYGMATKKEFDNLKSGVDKNIKRTETLEDVVDRDIVKFNYVAVSPYSGEWSEWTQEKWIGGKPDPWGGGHDGYFVVTHHYEIYRNMDTIPPLYIERSHKALKTGEYEKGDNKMHVDADANIIFSLQEIGDIEKGHARHWKLFTPTLVGTIIRYGGKTVMGNVNMNGQQHGSGSSAYWNLPLERGVTYDIYAYNNGISQYKLYIIKNGEYK